MGEWNRLRQVPFAPILPRTTVSCPVAVPRSRGETRTDEQSLQVRVPPHETAEELCRILGVPPAEDVRDELGPGAGVENALALEAAEGVGVEHLGPLVRI